jgi:hypothetical protein
MAEDQGQTARRPDETAATPPLGSTERATPAERATAGGTAPLPPVPGPVPPDGTRVLPPVEEEPARWAGSAQVRPPRPGGAPVAYEYEEEPVPIGPGERNWMLPVVVGAVALLLLGALLTGLWLIFTATDDQGPTPVASGPVGTSAEATTQAPTSAPPTPVTPTSEVPATVEVPRLAGLSEDEARQRLSDVGLRVQVERRPTTTADPGTVLEVQPGEGAEVAANSVVRIVVAAAPAGGASRSVDPTAEED